MFGLGMGELIVVAIVALLFLGPEKLPDAAKTISKGIRDFRKQTRELQQIVEDDNEIGGAIRDIKSALRGDDLEAAERRRRATEAARRAADNAAKAAEELADKQRGESPGPTTQKASAAGTPDAAEDGAPDAARSDAADSAGGDHADAATADLRASADASDSAPVSEQVDGMDDCLYQDPDLPVIKPAAGAVSLSSPSKPLFWTEPATSQPNAAGDNSTTEADNPVTPVRDDSGELSENTVSDQNERDRANASRSHE